MVVLVFPESTGADLDPSVKVRDSPTTLPDEALHTSEAMREETTVDIN